MSENVRVSKRASEITPFLVMDILEAAHRLEAEGHNVIHLEIGEPDFDTPECIKEAAKKALADGETHYTHSLGLLPLREAICYPRSAGAFCEPAILSAMESVGLTRLAPRLDERDSWEQVMPQRVQQQLGFVRLLLHRPTWVVLEEATDAFDPEGERQILEMLYSELPDATLLNISFHPDLGALHNRTLILNRASETKILFGERRGGNGAH